MSLSGARAQGGGGEDPYREPAERQPLTQPAAEQQLQDQEEVRRGFHIIKTLSSVPTSTVRSWLVIVLCVCVS